MMKWKCCLLFFVLVLVCIAWTSALKYDVHGPMARRIIRWYIDEDEFPDIHMYDGRICDGVDWNHKKDGEYWAHQPNPGEQNTGSPEALWEGDKDYAEVYEGEGVIQLYKRRKFKKAYYRIGNILHLVQDMAVPTHALNISHHSTVTDKHGG